MGWTEHTGDQIDLASASAEETLLLILSLTDPRDAESVVEHLDRHAEAIEARLQGRGRLAVLKGQSVRQWLFGPLGFVGPLGALAIGAGLGASYLFALPVTTFAVASIAAYLALRLMIVKPDRRDWLAVGTTLGAGVVAAWRIRRLGAEAPPVCDSYLRDALVDGPEYWHDLAARAVANLPVHRREQLVLDAFTRRPDDLWYLLPNAPTPTVVRAALARGPRSSATADFHAFGALIREASVEPVLEAIRAGARNRDVLIRAVAASGNPVAADLLIATLAERNERLRDVARDGLVGLGPSVLPKLFDAFATSDGWVQRGLARTLRAMRPDARIEDFAAGQLRRAELDETAAADLRRIVLTRQVLYRKITFGTDDIPVLTEVLTTIPAPAQKFELSWFDGTPLPPTAIACLTDMVLTEGPEKRCAELAGVRHLLSADSRTTLLDAAAQDAEHPVYRMVLAEDTELLRQHQLMADSRATAEVWVDVLERHASLAAVHALDELWRTGPDGGVQTAAMAALMRLSGQYDDLESFADRALSETLRDEAHPLHDVYARGQFARFEQMMVSARRVPPEQFRELYLTLPAQHVLWGHYDPQGVLRGAFRVDEDWVLVDERDELVEFPPGNIVGVAHPAELGATACHLWAEVFSDYELVPHFEQLQRPARRLSIDEAASRLFHDFPDRAPSGRLEAALIQRGWRPSPTDVETVYTLTKPVQRGKYSYTAVIETTPGFGEQPDEPQQVDFLAFWKGHHHVFNSVVQKLQLGEIDAVIFSEVVLELREVLATAGGEERSLPAIITPPLD